MEARNWKATARKLCNSNTCTVIALVSQRANGMIISVVDCRRCIFRSMENIRLRSHCIDRSMLSLIRPNSTDKGYKFDKKMKLKRTNKWSVAMYTPYTYTGYFRFGEYERKWIFVLKHVCYVASGMGGSKIEIVSKTFYTRATVRGAVPRWPPQVTHQI